MDVCAAVVFGAPVWVAGVARAGDDVGFLVALQRIGITYPSPAQAIDAARAVCVCLDRGESGLAVVQEVTARNPASTWTLPRTLRSSRRPTIARITSP
ncbi:hypothetical protein I551_4281 [Mycobacterium ulcerans str. Harvey]|uniref:DUF732 domain-containing protein n=1 Tax=Mycobacterium ulcerans str. Harvey TaxID=1299332 RepID=A0ABP3AHG9_MYCUL|nr:hypothetical protein I551_4281 [Mycobacterium ulcerans str. Harvey]